MPIRRLLFAIVAVSTLLVTAVPGHAAKDMGKDTGKDAGKDAVKETGSASGLQVPRFVSL